MNWTLFWTILLALCAFAALPSVLSVLGAVFIHVVDKLGQPAPPPPQLKP